MTKKIIYEKMLLRDTPLSGMQLDKMSLSSLKKEVDALVSRVENPDLIFLTNKDWLGDHYMSWYKGRFETDEEYSNRLCKEQKQHEEKMKTLRVMGEVIKQMEINHLESRISYLKGETN